MQKILTCRVIIVSHQYNQIFPSWLAFTGEEKVLDHLNFCTKKEEEKTKNKKTKNKTYWSSGQIAVYEIYNEINPWVTEIIA